MKRKLFRKGLVFCLAIVLVTISISPGVISKHQGMVSTFFNNRETILDVIMNKIMDNIFKLENINTGSDCDWEVPGDFDTIQAAIDHSEPGYIICVNATKKLTFYENIEIYKNDQGTLLSNLTLKGIGDRPIIDGSGNGNAVTIKSDNCKFYGFKIVNADEDGIKIFGESAHHNEVFDNIIENIQHGGVVIDYYSYDNIVRNNNIKNVGLELGYNLDGIWIRDHSCNNKIYNNTIDETTEHGINIGGGFESSEISVGDCNYNRIIGNIITNAEQDGILILDNSNNNLIHNNTVKYCGIGNIRSNGNGIDIGENCKYNNVSDNKINNIRNRHALTIGMGACYNNIFNNTIENNCRDGICIKKTACYNNIFNNNISGNEGYGIEVEAGTWCNTFYLNYMGFGINQENRADNAHDEDTRNHWNSTEKIWYKNEEGCGNFTYVGNWWNDYDGSDDDCNGRGGIPYPIKDITDNDGSYVNYDYYPIGLFVPAYIVFHRPDENHYFKYMGDNTLTNPYNFHWIVRPFPFTFQIDIISVKPGEWDVDPTGYVKIHMREWFYDFEEFDYYPDADGYKEVDIMGHPAYWQYEWKGGPYGPVDFKIFADITNGEQKTTIEGYIGVWHEFGFLPPSYWRP